MLNLLLGLLLQKCEEDCQKLLTILYVKFTSGLLLQKCEEDCQKLPTILYVKFTPRSTAAGMRGLLEITNDPVR